VVGGHDLEPLELEDKPQHLAEPAVVIDDEDSEWVFRHQAFPLRTCTN
jgi:hypothetical protein